MNSWKLIAFIILCSASSHAQTFDLGGLIGKIFADVFQSKRGEIGLNYDFVPIKEYVESRYVGSADLIFKERLQNIVEFKVRAYSQSEVYVYISLTNISKKRISFKKNILTLKNVSTGGQFKLISVNQVLNLTMLGRSENRIESISDDNDIILEAGAEKNLEYIFENLLSNQKTDELRKLEITISKIQFEKKELPTLSTVLRQY